MFKPKRLIQSGLNLARPAARTRVGGIWCGLIGLLLALAGGSGGLTAIPVAQAAPGGEASLRVFLFAQVVGGSHTICVGDKVVMRLRVLQTIGVEGDYRFGHSIGVDVGAFVDQSGVGTINPPRNTTRMDSEPIGSAYFIFKAEKPGTTTVVFKGKVNRRLILGFEISSDSLTAALPVTVENCKYRVTTISRWAVEGPAGLKIVANITRAGMSEVGGGQYKGTASVIWTVSAGQVGDCVPKQETSDSQAELDGQVWGPEAFIVDMNFLSAFVSLPALCFGSDGGVVNDRTPVVLTSEPLQFSVPAAGGATRLDHVIKGPGGRMVGPIVISVTRAAGQ